jgi:hypothetical protein
VGAGAAQLGTRSEAGLPPTHVRWRAPPPPPTHHVRVDQIVAQQHLQVHVEPRLRDLVAELLVCGVEWLLRPVQQARH